MRGRCEKSRDQGLGNRHSGLERRRAGRREKGEGSGGARGGGSYERRWRGEGWSCGVAD